MKKRKMTLILTSLVILIHAAAGLLLWERLPERVPIHFNFAGGEDGYCGKPFAVFVLPAIVLALHWVCVLAVCIDPKRENIDAKPLTLVLWICPAVMLAVSGLLYSNALGFKPDVPAATTALVGVLYLVLGNYLPKCKPNFTVGIRVSWALDDPENWRATHRVAGWTVSIGGVLILATVWLGNFWPMLVIAMAALLAPAVYSYVYYRRHRA